jgi:hypothetical protein
MEIPANVNFIESSAFLGVYDGVSVSNDNPHLRIVGTLLQDFSGSVIYHCFSRCQTIIIPSWVVVLGKMSFAGCRDLKSLTFESGSQLSEIEESAFAETGLTSIVIPSSVSVLGELCFAGCGSLESVTFENGSQLSRIGESAFSRTALKSIVIPSSVAELGKECFSACMSLQSVLFESNSRLAEIDESAFEWSSLDFRVVVKALAASRSIVQLLTPNI